MPMSVAPVSSTWATSGGAWLTGWADGPPLAAPAGVATIVGRAHQRLIESSRAPGATTSGGTTLAGLDAMALIGERAALGGLSRSGARSCGGATVLFPAADGWIAVALARPDDLALVPAWLCTEMNVRAIEPGTPDIAALGTEVSRRSVEELVGRATLVGLAVGALAADGSGEVSPSDPVFVGYHRSGSPIGHRPLVVDLSSLWAGPLCSDLLTGRGCDVIKVESSRRPDGLRADGSGLFDLLNTGKRSVALDLATAAGQRLLHRLVEAADVVIEGSRPRALEQMGIDARQVLAGRRTKVWLSITGFGRDGDAAQRPGFGDVAAVAGALVAWGDNNEPCFLGDAIADPLTGLVAAAAVADALDAGGSWLLDVAMARVAACAAQGIERPSGVLAEADVCPPRARSARGVAAALGADTVAVLDVSIGGLEGGPHR